MYNILLTVPGPLLPLGPSGCSASQPASPEAAPCGCFFPSTQSVGRGMIRCNGEDHWSGSGTHNFMQCFCYCTLFHYTTHHFSLQLLHVSGELLCMILYLFNGRLDDGGGRKERVKGFILDPNAGCY